MTLVAVAPRSSPGPAASPPVVGATTSSGTPIGSGAAPAPASVPRALAAVDQATLRAVGVPGGLVGPAKVTGDHTLLVGTNGKPEVLYVGAEYCPYCAAQRWALAVALSRFGTFTGLETTHSSTTDVYPDTRTLSFYGSTYTSAALDFVPVELTTNQLVGDQYPTLQHLTAAEQSVLGTYDRAPYTSEPGAIPFIDVANRYVMIGAGYSPTVLQGRSAPQIADAMTHPSSAIARRRRLGQPPRECHHRGHRAPAGPMTRPTMVASGTDGAAGPMTRQGRPSRSRVALASVTMVAMSSATVGSSSITPTTWPVGSTPTSVRPSTSAALVIMGALAAMTTCAHVSSLPSFMARPSDNSAPQRRVRLTPERQRIAERRGNAAARPAPSRWSTTSVRTTRCGAPSTRGSPRCR